MNTDPEGDMRRAQGRLAVYVIVFTAAVWVLATWAGNYFDWPLKSRLVFDGLALLGFGFAMAVIWRVWRMGRTDDEG